MTSRVLANTYSPRGATKHHAAYQRIVNSGINAKTFSDAKLALIGLMNDPECPHDIKNAIGVLFFTKLKGSFRFDAERASLCVQLISAIEKELNVITKSFYLTYGDWDATTTIARHFYHNRLVGCEDKYFLLQLLNDQHLISTNSLTDEELITHYLGWIASSSIFEQRSNILDVLLKYYSTDKRVTRVYEQMRWGDTVNKNLYNDAQNVHDTDIQASVINSCRRLLEWAMPPEYKTRDHKINYATLPTKGKEIHRIQVLPSDICSCNKMRTMCVCLICKCEICKLIAIKGAETPKTWMETYLYSYFQEPEERATIDAIITRSIIDTTVFGGSAHSTTTTTPLAPAVTPTTSTTPTTPATPATAPKPTPRPLRPSARPQVRPSGRAALSRAPPPAGGGAGSVPRPAGSAGGNAPRSLPALSRPGGSGPPTQAERNAQRKVYMPTPEAVEASSAIPTTSKDTALTFTIADIFYTTVHYIRHKSTAAEIRNNIRSEAETSLLGMLMEEMTAMKGLCASGYIARFMTVLQCESNRQGENVFAITISDAKRAYSILSFKLNQAYENASDEVVEGTLSDEFAPYYYEFVAAHATRLLQDDKTIAGADVLDAVNKLVNKPTTDVIWSEQNRVIGFELGGGRVWPPPEPLRVNAVEEADVDNDEARVEGVGEDDTNAVGDFVEVEASGDDVTAASQTFELLY